MLYEVITAVDTFRIAEEVATNPDRAGDGNRLFDRRIGQAGEQGICSVDEALSPSMPP